MQLSEPLQTAIQEHRLSVILQQLEFLLGRVQHGCIELVFVDGRLVRLHKNEQTAADATASLYQNAYK